MPEPTTIDPTPPKNPGLDFYALKREATRLVQTLAGGVWAGWCFLTSAKDHRLHEIGVRSRQN